MKVKELIEVLQDCPEDALVVLLISNQGYKSSGKVRSVSTGEYAVLIEGGQDHNLPHLIGDK